ncbi:MAG: two-component system, OmpR family, sensor histidine kinase KdpD [Actinomycetota bacterium]|nr:two-component system, OmpR family, sensor histidine kinase KdpD [Actinomycetota bacterium]
METPGSILSKNRRSLLRGLATAVAGASLVTLLALLERQLSTTTAALLYVLVVVVAAGVGGPLAGIVASLLSFLALNFFFTEPIHTFVVGKPEDLVALVVFLIVSVVTGLLLSTAVRERSRSELREQQTQLMNRFTSRLLSGRGLEDVLEKLAGSLSELLDLAECDIATTMTRRVYISNGVDGGEAFEIDLEVKGEKVGSLRVTPPSARKRLTPIEQAVLQNVAGQLALALESTRLTDEVRSAQLDAETNSLRAALFSGVTHDLKTPLSAITASVTSLIEGQDFSEQERFDHLDTIRLEAAHLDRVVTNLMDLARLRAGALVPARVPAAIDELIEAVVARLQPLLAGRDVDLRFKADLPEMQIDVVQVDQVLTNLIENAAKFSPPGSPIVISAAGGSETVRVTVADRGPGIPAVDRERIFQPFERGSGEVAGTGLGLAIARAAVVAHGGRMWAQDGPGGGATITFELPTNANGHR